MSTSVFEHIIHLTNELNAFDPTFRKIAIPRSVCEVYPDRKTQQTQITLRLKQILDLRNAAQHSTSDTLEAGQYPCSRMFVGLTFKQRMAGFRTSTPRSRRRARVLLGRPSPHRPHRR
jgi:hypothetical protein